MAGRWMEKYSKTETPLMDATEAIQQARLGKLVKSVLIAPNEEYADLWGSLLWLCPDDISKARIREKYPGEFSLSAKEFFEVCEGRSRGEDMKPVIETLRLFGGSLEIGVSA